MDKQKHCAMRMRSYTLRLSPLIPFLLTLLNYIRVKVVLHFFGADDLFLYETIIKKIPTTKRSRIKNDNKTIL